MIIGFTGSRRGMTPIQAVLFAEEILRIQIVEFHHGMCVGADEEAEAMVRQAYPKCVIYGHPPKNKRWFSRKSKPDHIAPEYEYLVRNRHIVDRVQVMFATPATVDAVIYSGTWATISYALRRGIPLRIIKPYPQIIHNH